MKTDEKRKNNDEQIHKQCWKLLKIDENWWTTLTIDEQIADN